MTGDGMTEFFEAVEEARKEYDTDYKPELDRMIAEREATKSAKKADSLTRLLADMKVKGGPPTTSKSALDSLLEPNDEEEEDDDDDGEVIDKSEFFFYRLSLLGFLWLRVVWVCVA